MRGRSIVAGVVLVVAVVLRGQTTLAGRWQGTTAPVATSASLKPVQSDLNPLGNRSSIVYKTTPQGDLKVDLYLPKGWQATDSRPAIILFFGGGFTGGSTTQFARMAEYFASRGLVSAAADYRVRSRHGTGPEQSIEDARSAIRWLRVTARRLGIDPQRIIAGGGSSGGTCAVLAAYSSAYQPGGENQAVSDCPNALVLFNPALSFGGRAGEFPEAQVKALEVLTSHVKVTAGPPAIQFFGTEDALIGGGRAFVEHMIAAGNRAELYTAEGQNHGFFNGPGWQEAVVHQSDLFLASLGYLNGQPTIAHPSTQVLRKALP